MKTEKYLIQTANSIQTKLAYRFDFFSGILVLLIPFAIKNYLWLLAFDSNNGNQISNYDWQAILTYNIFAMVFGVLIKTFLQFSIAYEIKDGNLNRYLVKPINHLFYWISNLIGEKIIEFIYIAVFFSFLMLFFFEEIMISINTSYIPLTLLVLSLSILLYFLMFYVISLLAFWLLEIPSFFMAINFILSFLNGEVIPLDVLPSSVRNIIQYLPFNYSLFFPIQVIMNRLSYTEILTKILYQIIWIIIFMFLSYYAWDKGIKKYEAVGG